MNNERPTHSDFISGISEKEKDNSALIQGFRFKVSYEFGNKTSAYYCRSIGSANNCKSQLTSLGSKAVIVLNLGNK